MNFKGLFKDERIRSIPFFIQSDSRFIDLEINNDLQSAFSVSPLSNIQLEEADVVIVCGVPSAKFRKKIDEMLQRCTRQKQIVLYGDELFNDDVLIENKERLIDDYKIEYIINLDEGIQGLLEAIKMIEAKHGSD